MSIPFGFIGVTVALFLHNMPFSFMSLIGIIALAGVIVNNAIVMIDFVKRSAEKAQFVTSHCDGAFVLAKAGLLNNVTSTTFPSDIGAYKEMFPHLKVKDSVLFVHDGKYITSAGGAKSFEAALYLCEHLYGKEITNLLAKGLVIDWDLSNIPKLILP